MLQADCLATTTNRVVSLGLYPRPEGDASFANRTNSAGREQSAEAPAPSRANARRMGRLARSKDAGKPGVMSAGKEEAASFFVLVNENGLFADDGEMHVGAYPIGAPRIEEAVLATLLAERRR